MKRGFIFLIATLFLISFVFAVNGSNGNNNNSNQENAEANQDDDSTKPFLMPDGSNQEEYNEAVRIREAVQTRNRLRIQSGECPDNCTCTGSAVKCQLKNGREMTIRAGNSGNTIVQVKGINMSTKVVLYKSEDKIYGTFKNNETREIKILPDAVKEKINQRIKAKLENQTIELDEDGVYQVQSKKRARLFLIIPIRERVQAQINSETGEIIRIRNSWWGFLARDVKED